MARLRGQPKLAETEEWISGVKVNFPDSKFIAPNSKHAIARADISPLFRSDDQDLNAEADATFKGEAYVCKSDA
jgi:hypothetical protein